MSTWHRLSDVCSEEKESAIQRDGGIVASGEGVATDAGRRGCELGSKQTRRRMPSSNGCHRLAAVVDRQERTEERAGADRGEGEQERAGGSGQRREQVGADRGEGEREKQQAGVDRGEGEHVRRQNR
jgi:hypothetical protein